MTNKELQGERLQEILFALNISQNTFCEMTGSQQSHLSNAIQGKKGISFGMLEKTMRTFPQVNLNRIFTGEGPVLYSTYTNISSEVRERGAVYAAKGRCEHLEALRQRLLQSLTIIEHIIAEDCQK